MNKQFQYMQSGPIIVHIGAMLLAFATFVGCQRVHSELDGVYQEDKQASLAWARAHDMRLVEPSAIDEWLKADPLRLVITQGMILKTYGYPILGQTVWSNKVDIKHLSNSEYRIIYEDDRQRDVRLFLDSDGFWLTIPESPGRFKYKKLLEER